MFHTFKKTSRLLLNIYRYAAYVIKLATFKFAKVKIIKLQC